MLQRVKIKFLSVKRILFGEAMCSCNLWSCH